MKSNKVLNLAIVCLLALFLLSTTGFADLEIEAKAFKTESNKDEEIWVIRIGFENTGKTPLGPLVIQYRSTGFDEFEADGKPTTGDLKHTEGTIPQELSVMEPGQKGSVDAPGMSLAGNTDNRNLVKGMIQSIRVRAWQHGKLVGEFSDKSGKAADVEWPLNPPLIPEGAEAGSGPWLLLEKERADFSGIQLGASANEVLQMLKTCGANKVDAKPEPLHGHPLRMTSADLPGVIFGFDAAKKLSAIEISDPSRLKLPGKLLLGKSALADYDSVFGAGTKPDPLPPGAEDARTFQRSGASLTVTNSSALLEQK